VGSVEAIFVCPQRGAPMEARRSAVALEDWGLQGCVHARPGRKRQVLLVSADHLDAVGVEPGTIRENVTVAGTDVQAWPIGQRVRAGDAVFEMTMVCDPCERMDAIRPGLRTELEGRRGMLARIVAGGQLAVGDTLELVD
jgi:MOSC domain-containing protein YiiM